MAEQFTFIRHDVRRAFNLSLNEYAICDSIHNLSQSEDHNYTCLQSKENIGEWIGVSRQSAHNIINKLIEARLIEKRGDGYCTTKEWKKAISLSEKGECQKTLQCKKTLHRKKSLQPVSKNLTGGVKKLDTKCKKTLHNSNTIPTIKDKDKDNISETPKENLFELERLYFESMKVVMPSYDPKTDYNYGRDRKIINDMIKKHGIQKFRTMLGRYFKNGIGEKHGYSITSLKQDWVWNALIQNKIPVKTNKNSDFVKEILNA